MKALPDKIDPLIRRLSTDNDGEAVACVRAIGRVLKSAGLSWHDLADAVMKPTASTYYEQPGRKRYEPPPPPPPFDLADFDSWLHAVNWLCERADDPFAPMRQNEREFVRSARDGIRSFGKPTEKQEKWLRDILKRCGKL